MQGLTKRQAQVMDFLLKFAAQNTHSPSFSEIADAVCLSSLGPVHELLRQLKVRGLITYEPYKARSIRVLAPAETKAIAALREIIAAFDADTGAEPSASLLARAIDDGRVALGEIAGGGQ